MTTLTIEKILNNSIIVTEHDITLNDENNMFNVDIKIETPRDSDDMGTILRLKNKIRQQVDRSFKLNFNIRFVT